VRYSGLVLALSYGLLPAGRVHAAPVPIALDTPLRIGLAPHEKRIEEHLLRLVEDAAGGHPGFVEGARALIGTDTQDRALIRITTTDVAGLAASLTRPDVTLTFADSRYGAVEAWVPLSQIDALAQEETTLRIVPVTRGYTRACDPLPGQGSVTAEADCILKARDARTASGLDGTGVTVGVISDGVDGWADSVATGDLPAHITMLNQGAANQREGRAMLEIVHDMAPGASLSFCSYGQSSLTFANAVTALAGGCNVIVDDMGFFNEPDFADGPAAQAVASAIASGVTWVTAAGNDAQRHWYGTFGDGGATTLSSAIGPITVSHAHVWGHTPTGAPVLRLPVVLPGNTATSKGSVSFFLQWNNAWGAATDDYDLYVVDAAGNIVAESTNPSRAGTNPFEEAYIHNNTTADQTVYVVVALVSGNPCTLQLFTPGSRPLSAYGVTANSIFGHPAVPAAISVGAISADDAPAYSTPEDYSSRGPVNIGFPAPVVRSKPDVMGMDDVVTSVPGFVSFSGTSAAAPTVAAIAALLMQGSPGLAPAQVSEALTKTAVDLGPAGWDANTGYGRVDGLAAVTYAQATVSASPSSITYTAQECGFPGYTQVQLNGTFATRGASAPWSVSANVPWLHFDRTSGVLTGTDTFRVWADTTGLSAPGAAGRITVQMPDSNPTFLPIDVSLNLTAAPNSFVVTGTVRDDDQPGVTTFQDAITYANSHAGTVVKFNIPTTDKYFSGGVAHIPYTGWWIFNQNGTVIDGFSETDFVHDTNPNGPEIEFDNFEFYVTAANCVIRGIADGNVTPSSDPTLVNPAIVFTGSGAVNNRVYGCYIGLDATGTVAKPDEVGIDIEYGSNNLIGGSTPAERNLIAGNADNIQIYEAGNNVVSGNWLGLNAAGAKVGGSHRGLLVYSSTGTEVGGSHPGEGNVASGNDYDGIAILSPGSTGNRVIGNLLGTDPTGLTAVPNGISGVHVTRPNNDIGGASPGERNVISGNGAAGIAILGSDAYGIRVMGNLVGVAADGTTALPNGAVPSSVSGAPVPGGIVIDGGAHDNIIGGLQSETGKRNVIAGNIVAGVRIRTASTKNTVIGNTIGCTDFAGSQPLANQGPGIFLEAAAVNNTIGGVDPLGGTSIPAGNRIAWNTGAGIAMTADASHTNVVSRNAIHDNGGLGIDLGNDGGPSIGYYTAPALTTAYRYTGFTLVSGSYSPGTDPAILEFYSSPAADPSGYGEGKTFLAAITVTTSGTFAFSLPTLDPGTVVAAVAIHQQNGQATDSSEFSNAVTVQDPSPAVDHGPIVTLQQPNGGETVTGGTLYTIQWNVSYFAGLQSQQIDYSLDSGTTWTTAAMDVDPGVRTWSWEVPPVQTGQALVRVTATDSAERAASATSAADFTIHTMLPWSLGDAAEALRIYAGLQMGGLAEVNRLDLETANGSSGRIDIRDVLRIARKASHLDP